MITRNKQCTVQPVTVCTDAVTVLYKDHTVFIEALGESAVSVTVDGESIPAFPYRDSWLALEQPDPMQVRQRRSRVELTVNKTTKGRRRKRTNVVYSCVFLFFPLVCYTYKAVFRYFFAFLYYYYYSWFFFVYSYPHSVLLSFVLCTILFVLFFFP